MDILLVTSSFNDEIHGSDDKKKTGCGISLIKPENVSKYRIGGVMTDLKEISCDKCKERLAKKIIRSDKKEMSRILKEERARAKKGIEDEGIIPLGNTTAKITKTPEQKRREEELAEAARKEAEAARIAEEETRRNAEEEARKKAEEEAAQKSEENAAQKNIPGTSAAMNSDLAQFAINVPKEEEPAPEPVQDDFLAQFAIQKPQEDVPEEPQPADIQDDFLAQFAIPSPAHEPEYQPVETDGDFYGYEDYSDKYENDDSVINVSEDELRSISEETVSQPSEEQDIGLGENSDWDFVANQIFGFEGVDVPETQLQPAEMEELPLPPQPDSHNLDGIRSAEPKTAAAVLEDIVPPVLDDIKTPALDDIALPVLEELSAPVSEQTSAPAVSEISVPEIPVLDELSAFEPVPEIPEKKETAAAADETLDFEIPEVPVLNSISAPVSEEAAATTDEASDFEIPEVPVLNSISAPVAEEAAVTTDETSDFEIPEVPALNSISAPEAGDAVISEIPVNEKAYEEYETAESEETKETSGTEIYEDFSEPAEAESAPIDKILPVSESEQTAAPVQTEPFQQVSAASAPPVSIQTAPPVQPVPVQQPQIITVPQFAGYDASGQPIYTYMQMQITGYDTNGQPIYAPIGGQQPPIPPQVAAPQPRPMMGMSNTMGGQMGANIQKPYVQLDAPTQTPAYIKSKLGSQNPNGHYVQPSANISKIAVNPHSKETSQAFVNAISNSKDYANKNLIETQGLRANTPVLSSIEDVLSQMGDNSLKNKKAMSQQDVKVGSEYRTPSAPRSSVSKAVQQKNNPENDIRYMSKSALKDKKKQDKIDAKFKKDMAKRGF